MMVARRTFLLGLASAMAVPALPAIAKQSELIGETIFTKFQKFSEWRKLCDISFSSMPMGDELRSGFVEDPVRFSFWRNDQEFLPITMNPRSVFRWVAAPGHEIVFQKGDILSMHVEPCHTITTLAIDFDTEKDSFDPRVRPKVIRESYRWRDGKIEVEDQIAADYRDQRLVKEI